MLSIEKFLHWLLLIQY